MMKAVRRMGTLSREETPAFSFLLSALGSMLKGKTFALQGVSELGLTS